MVSFYGGRLKEVREIKDLTQIEASQKLGVTKQQWSQWEIGKQVPTVNTLVRICNTFDCPPRIFFVHSVE